jgi:NACalpha-BTF3-like transcription factor
LSSSLQAANVFITKREKENEERLAKERELQKVQVKKEDIELIVRKSSY